MLVVAVALLLVVVLAGLVIARTSVPVYTDGGRADQRTVHMEPFVAPVDEPSHGYLRLVDAPPAPATPDRALPARSREKMAA